MKEKNFATFCTELKQALHSLAGEDAFVDIHETRKNNNVSYFAVTVMKKGSIVSPNVGLQEFYREYQEGAQTERIAGKIWELCENCKAEESVQAKIFRDFGNFEKVRDKICFRLVSYEKNKEALERMPYVKFLDLAVTFYCYLDFTKEKGEHGAVRIENTHLDIWGISEGELYDLAMENTRRIFPVRCFTFPEVMDSMIMRREDPAEAEEWKSEEKLNEWAAKAAKEAEPGLSMYVMSNYKTYFGAATLYYPGVLQKLADAFGTDLVILPSSVHEVLIMPIKEEKNFFLLNGIIRDVNRDHVAAAEVLSDHLYCYDRERKELYIPVF